MNILGAALGATKLDASLMNIKLDGNLSSIVLDGDLSNILLDGYIGKGFKLVSDLEVGDSFGGGIIAYKGEEFKNGFIAYPEWEYDESGNRVVWGCRGTSIGSTGTEIGDGENNTNMITHELEGCDELPNAASVCADANTNGYSDWYLPSYNEVLVLSENYTTFQLQTQAYWSSSEVDNERALRYVFNFDITQENMKNGISRVRPIRNY